MSGKYSSLRHLQVRKQLLSNTSRLNTAVLQLHWQFLHFHRLLSSALHQTDERFPFTGSLTQHMINPRCDACKIEILCAVKLYYIFFSCKIRLKSNLRLTVFPWEIHRCNSKAVKVSLFRVVCCPHATNMQKIPCVCLLQPELVHSHSLVQSVVEKVSRSGDGENLLHHSQDSSHAQVFSQPQTWEGFSCWNQSQMILKYVTKFSFETFTLLTVTNPVPEDQPSFYLGFISKIIQS